MGKVVEFGTEARAEMQIGLDTLADAVKVTLGPRGRNAAIETRFGAPMITKDGVTVARSINLSNRLQNMGANLVKTVAQATNMAAGDGTTTATVLSQAIYTKGAQMVAAGAGPIQVKRGIDMAVTAVVKKLKEISIPVEDDKLEHVAIISSNNDEILGKIIAEAVTAVGEYGMISVEEATGTETNTTYTEGMRLDRGYTSVGFLTNAQRGSVEYENSYVLTYGDVLSDIQDLATLMGKVHGEGKPILIIARDFSEQVTNFLVYNKLKSGLAVCAVKAPGFGDNRTAMLDDVSALCGSTFFTNLDQQGLKDAEVSDLGTVRKISVTQNNTYIIDGGGSVSTDGEPSAIDVRTEELSKLIGSVDNHDYQEEFFRERLAKLTGGVAVIHVGGITDTEMSERKDRVEDSVNAVRAAIEEGIVPGGGSALLHCMSALDEIETTLREEEIGIEIVRQALTSPFRQIMDNAGFEWYKYQGKILDSKGKGGFDALNGVYIKDMVKAGIIDPTKVVRAGLLNAASASGILLTTEVAIFEEEVEK